MKKVLLIVTIAGGLFFSTYTTMQAYVSSIQTHPSLAPARPEPHSASEMVNSAYAIGPSRRISIPFGFATPLPSLNMGREIPATGHGGCTADERFTVTITITQSTTGAVARGDREDICTGELQMWYAMTAAETITSFVTGPAEACGLATTYDEQEMVTDTYSWCKDVELMTLNNQLALPIISNP